jgi:uncharacterized DUF497 family protein
MKITFDPDKDALNIRDHKVSLAQAEGMDWDNALTWYDGREDYGEDRYIALGLIGNKVYYAAFVERNEEIRMISMRRATNQEIKKYVDATQN